MNHLATSSLSKIICYLSPIHAIIYPLIYTTPTNHTRHPFQIAESFRRFGITPTTTSLLVIKVLDPSGATSISDHLSASIQGTPIPFEDAEIAKITDVTRVKKVYKLNNVPSLGGGGGGKKTNGVVNGVGGRSGEEGRKELEVLILGAMALRGNS